MEIIQQVLLSVSAGMILGIAAYMSKSQKGESFEIKKLLRTGFIGSTIGLILCYNGIPVTEDNYVTYMAANGGIITLIDKIWTFGFNFMRKKGWID